MIKEPLDVLTLYPVRKTKLQKQAFRDDVCAYFEELGYSCNIEKGSFGVRNVVVGNPDTAKHVITAHYDTPARLPFANLATPCNSGTFLLWQIFLCCVIFAPALAMGAFIGYLFHSELLGNIVYMILLVANCWLTLYGPANQNNANDNTSGVVTLLSIAAHLPLFKREDVCFVLFDLEEAGMLGSSCYFSQHSLATKEQIVLNLDCVGDGDNIVFFPTKKLRKDKARMDWLRQCVGSRGCKNFTIRESGFSFFPSDHASFPLGVGIAALKKSKKGLLYCNKIHTKKDTVLDEDNVEIISECLINLVLEDDGLSISSIGAVTPKKRLSPLVRFLIVLIVSAFLGFLIGVIYGYLSMPTV